MAKEAAKEPAAKKPSPRRERELNLSVKMSDHEALMWNVEKDPWLNPNGASITILDKPVDMDRFRNQIAYGVSKMPRLYQRVVPGFGRFSPPSWAPDPEFDLDFHVREVVLPSPGTERQLFDLAAQLYEEPLDRTRPLWRFVAISGLEGGRGAIYSLTHHVIADGIGQLRMAELYQQISPDEEPPDPVDLDALVADAVAEHRGPESDGDRGADFARSLPSNTQRTVGHLARRQLGIGRRLAGELMMWPADPERAVEQVEKIAGVVTSTVEMLNRPNDEDPGGSPLWKNRSRHRRLEHVRVPLADLKAAANALGGSINDAFMIALTEGAVRYHAERDVTVDQFNTSFVVSTRSDTAMGGNSFTPVLVQVSGRNTGFATRMKELQEATGEAREKSDRSGGITGLSGLVNLLPTSVVTSMARKQSASIDFATSNLRGAPIPIYCVGSRVEATICMGPLAGTAANITALSTDGQFDIGMFLDPVAIEDTEAYRRNVAEAFDDLLAETSSSPTGTEKPKAKAGPKKKAAKTATKKTTKKPAKKTGAKAKAAANGSAGKTTKSTKSTKKAARSTTKKTAKKRAASRAGS